VPVKVCILGGGGREHALAWAADKFGHEVVVVPGNAGIPWASSAEPGDSDLYVLGTDDAVCSGQGDRLRQAGHLVFGPGRDGGRLEGSKQWMKELLASAGVPTARHATVTDATTAERFLRTLPAGYVVKTDNLALGKGVLVTDDLEEAIADARSKLEHGAVVIEEKLDGLEKVVEWNARWGDPEAQVLLPLFESDPYELMAEAAAGAITAEPRFQNRAAVTVVLASAGYPETPRVGDRIHGLEQAMSLPDVLLFSAGVGPDTTTNGGRVLNVTALGDDVAHARARAYEAVDLISWPGMQHRRDIALAAVN